ncbi:hypothetical protein KQ874_02920 [Mycoplasma sp. ES3157-GEN-MYC]|uniref:Uncharacterized protein n=1 Tax=Mycoplasma miroungigenitalium TaxID=754515 RepID=A0A6M4J9X4_9MOLU|nr:hypothetical protein [Mycoplasma miroungigenitalium]MBU4690630.1 hypothetical protein [Mycoplasma miroungigenitalium]MBU4691897.1 hypothetical protein [Mycoplasma miroungigenitalium]QJR43753.1 hypothetical protein HLA87_03120 [Mycoplasma miroungigenitalium]
MKKYFKESFKRTKTIHFSVVLVLGWALFIAVVLVQHFGNKYNGNLKYVFGDAFLATGLLYLSYGVIALSIKAGLGSGLVKISENRNQTKLQLKINKLQRNASLSTDQRIELRVLNDELEQLKTKQSQNEKVKHHNFIFWLLVILGIVLLLVSISLIYL